MTKLNKRLFLCLCDRERGKEEWDVRCMRQMSEQGRRRRQLD
jgi:hypothetical protein